MKTYTIQELRNAPIQIKMYSEEQAIKLAYAAGYYTDWKPFNAKYPIYCYLTECECPSWNPSPLKIKSTIIEFNQIKNFMENKKIIGYKLIKPEYRKAVAKIVEDQIDFLEEFFDNLFLCNNLNAFSITNLEKARVLDLWFEAVYEEKYKVGDWIKVTKEIADNKAKKGYIGKLTKIRRSTSRTKTNYNNVFF